MSCISRGFEVLKISLESARVCFHINKSVMTATPSHLLLWKHNTMSTNPMQPSSFSFFFLPLILISMAAYTDAITSPYSPTDYFLLDCGSSSNTTASSDGRTRRGDSGSATSNFSSFESKADKQGPSVEQVPYLTARIFKSQFQYRPKRDRKPKSNEDFYYY